MFFTRFFQCKESVNFGGFYLDCRKMKYRAAFGGVLAFLLKNKPCFLPQNDKKSAFILASFCQCAENKAFSVFNVLVKF